ncbi:MAG: hypothetical protein WCI31_17125 [Prolixibacteraceae bacterium]
MTTLELKRAMMHRITEINDVSFLKAVKIILDSKTDNEVITLTPEQKQEIIASKKEIEQGSFIDHYQLNKDVSKWLNEK